VFYPGQRGKEEGVGRRPERTRLPKFEVEKKKERRACGSYLGKEKQLIHKGGRITESENELEGTRTPIRPEGGRLR